MKISRRDWLRISAGAGLAPLCGSWGALMAEDSPVIHMTVPSTGEQLPAVGIGTVDFSGATSPAEMAPLGDILQLFHNLGGRLIDTSPNYGNAEDVLGHLLAKLNLRKQVFMATKVDREDPAEGIERMEGSIKRLGVPVDLMQVHNLRGTDAELKTMMDWKEQGKIRYIGVTTHRNSQHAEMEQVLRKYPLDFIQVNYSLADRAAAERLLPLAQDRGVAVLVNRPFGDGNMFQLVRDVELPAWAGEFDANSWAQLFLKYIISHPAETLPIPGMTKPHHVQDNMQAMRGRLPDSSIRKQMEKFMDTLL